MPSLTLAELDPNHRDIFLRALSRVTQTDLAQVTYAQIIDGAPLSDVWFDIHDSQMFFKGHAVGDHEELCDGSMDKLNRFKDSFDPETLSFRSELLLDFKAASPGSMTFKMRLVEMIAVAVHQIGAIIFKLDLSLHKSDEIGRWEPPKSNTFFWKDCPEGPPKILFYHTWYGAVQQYPDGDADMVGYWAEARILGGVVLFDRRHGVPDQNREAIFFHSDRFEVTYRIYQLTDQQRLSLLNFLLSDDEPQSSPLPILGTIENTKRVDPEEDIAETGIYRDLWERPPITPAQDRRKGDCVAGLDWPDSDEREKSWERARQRRWRFEEAERNARAAQDADNDRAPDQPGSMNG